MFAAQRHDVWAVTAGRAPLLAAAGAAGWPVMHRDPLSQLLRRLFDEQPSVAVVDVERSLAAMRALQVLHERHPRMAIVALDADAAMERDARATGVAAYLDGHAGTAALIDVVEALVKRQRERRPAETRPQPSKTIRVCG